MNKVLVKVIVPKITKNYEVFLPVNRTILGIINMISKSLSDIYEGEFPMGSIKNVYNRENGEKYNYATLIKNTDIENGTTLILY